MIWGIDQEKQEIAEGDTVRLECGAIIYNHSDKIVWRKDGEELIESHRIRFDSPNTKFSYRKSLIWDNIAMEDSGTYECEVYRRDTEEYAASRIIQIEVHPSSPPSIIPNFNQTQISLPMGENLQLDCLLKGLPTPTISWYKNDEPFKVEENDLDENQRQRVIQNDDFSITFYFLKPEDSGVYKCHAENRLGADEKQVELIVESE
jgi:FMS-like tyrosine kinase 1